MVQLRKNRQRALAGLILSGLGGLLLAVLAMTTIGTASDGPLWLLSAPPAILSLSLVVGGLQVARGVLGNSNALRVPIWALGGTTLMLGIAGWLLVLEQVAGATIPHMTTIATTAATLGAFVGAVVGLYNTTIREQARTLRAREAELAERNERLEQFASFVSHDLRNPLNVAKGRLELAMETEPGDHLPAIEQSLDRMETLIDDLLVLAREGDEVDDLSPLDLQQAVDQAWEQVPTNGASLESVADRTIFADESKLVELLENLFRNAVEHGPEDVTIRVEPMETGFAVEDDGPGIPPAKRDEVLKAGVSGTNDGSGLGLYIVSIIAEAHGWSLTVTEGVRGGARFEFRDVKSPTDTLESDTRSSLESAGESKREIPL